MDVEEEFRVYYEDKCGASFLASELSLLRLREQVKRCAEEIPKNCKVLEVGCGCGYVLSLLTTLRPDLTITATDIKPSTNWDWLREKGYEIKQDDATDSDFDNGSFGCVVSFGVMEHTAKPERFVAEIHRILTPDGICLIFNLPNRWALNDFMARALGKGGHGDRYTKKRVNGLLGQFEITELYREQLIPAQFYRISNRLNRFVNNHHKQIDKLDRMLMHTPLSLFAQSYYIKAIKK